MILIYNQRSRSTSSTSTNGGKADNIHENQFNFTQENGNMKPTIE
jgi:hypothetical protein